MARRENAREDLLAEATALVERAEFSILGESESIVIGFRAVGAASVYFGQNEAYHFDSAGRLRRAFLAPRMYKADGGRLASLERLRTSDEVQLVRHDLEVAELSQFLDRLTRRVGAIKESISAASVIWLREVPEGGAVRSRIAEWLAGMPERVEVAQSARVG